MRIFYFLCTFPMFYDKTKRMTFKRLITPKKKTFNRLNMIGSILFSGN